MTAEQRTMDRSHKGLDNKGKGMATEAFWVVEVVLCWVVALPVVLIAFFGLTLWEKIEKLIRGQPRHPFWNRLPASLIEACRKQLE